jgi:6-pyruvoyltetrahydropterin/6-carboxytetrahydropterin synthase
MMFEISAERRFSASHQLRLYDGTLEPLHGHNWRVRVTVAAEKLDAIGVVMDFHELERRLADVVERFHNCHLNEQAPFKTELNPSAENVALHVARAIELPAGVRLVEAEVWETGENRAAWREEGRRERETRRQGDKEIGRG